MFRVFRVKGVGFRPAGDPELWEGALSKAALWVGLATQQTLQILRTLNPSSPYGERSKVCVPGRGGHGHEGWQNGTVGSRLA